MKFRIEEPRNQNCSLIYRENDYSFDIEPLDGSGDTSILINDLQLEIDDEGKIMYVWGYCPLIKYEDTNNFPVEYQRKTLFALLEEPLIPGISHRINEHESWPIYINKNKGWVCIGNPTIEKKQTIEFAPNCIAVLDNQEIISLWLRPEKLPRNL